MVSRGSYLILHVAFLSLGIACAQTDSANVTVRGHVYDSSGRPLAGARVIAFALEASSSGPQPFAMSGNDGLYRLVLPAYGRTRICASKKGAGYPDTMLAIFASGHENEPEVNAVAGIQLNDIDVKLPPPDGSIQIIVVDKLTHAPVAMARITLRREENTSVMFATDMDSTGKFYVDLPDRPIQASITAPGYQPWSYKDDITGNAYVRIASGIHKVVTAQLIPSS